MNELKFHARFGKLLHCIIKAESHVSLAFYESDPVDLAIEWGQGEATPIPVIMPAHDKRPGGDWEAGMSMFPAPVSS
jgi:hypothetical protein